ncbi:hypothetical protein UFOVP714_61 [uncultured Caudovirales phage]|jgi:hypothetical protein|uniref:Uncharacterized protein n=1 Tax=uncultured Caudovirales phage TaxID=2100421 RepID=A0A6J5PFP7_9CAUD|nr:hypothetical protein UFOVP714_61 [uncultured Caudovirales phage]CAB4167958.1 hypothetical protein UFOVP864_72 [uncultured Caudovirales phage]
MAFSNTVSQTNFNTRRVIDNAIRRCKLTAQQITAEHIDIANDQLYLFLSDLANQGAPLWCIEKQIYPLYDGVGDITMTDGTVDILNSNFRWLQQVTGINYDTSTYREVDFTDDIFVANVGILWSAAAVPIVLERSDDGVVWDEIQSETPTASAGEWTWYDLDSSVAARYFRVRATSGTLGFSQIYLANTPTEIPLARMNRDDYTNLPNKAFQSNRPLQYWFDRQVNNPIMHMWPVPNLAATVCQIVVWRQRYIMDVGTMTQDVEVPQRWLEAIVSGLAAKMALELVEVDVSLIPILDQKAAIALNIAQMEERDNSPMMIAPNIAPYTR